MDCQVNNKTTRIGDTQFWYDADRKKVKQQTGDKVTYFYAGGAYEVEETPSSEKRTIRVGNYVKKVVGSSITEEYHLTDHLGSTDVITNAAGSMVQRMAFDAFGNRLESHFAANDSTASGSSNYKGYTGHDMVDKHGLIHMGGRVYDPDAGRFLSADIFVQAPNNAQSFNRYSYVFNNPLSNTDPTGYYSESEHMSQLANNGGPMSFGLDYIRWGIRMNDLKIRQQWRDAQQSRIVSTGENMTRAVQASLAQGNGQGTDLNRKERFVSTGGGIVLMQRCWLLLKVGKWGVYGYWLCTGKRAIDGLPRLLF